jgi:hypothetical protein
MADNSTPHTSGKPEASPASGASTPAARGPKWKVQQYPRLLTGVTGHPEDQYEAVAVRGTGSKQETRSFTGSYDKSLSDLKKFIAKENA